MPGQGRSGSVVIASGQPYSGVIDTDGMHFLALQLPAAMDGTSFTLYGFAGAGASGDGAQAFSDAFTALGAGPGAFRQIFDAAGVALPPITFAPDTCVGVDSDVMSKLAGFRFIALKSSTTETAARTVGYSLKA